MQDDKLLDMAKEMYLSYGEVTKHLNYMGKPMPFWQELPETIQSAWVAAATTGYHLTKGTE